MPWDPNAGITDISTPEGWDWSIETRGVENDATGWDGQVAWQFPNDPFGVINGNDFTFQPQVLHFYTGCGSEFGGETAAVISPNGPLGSATNGPSDSGWGNAGSRLAPTLADRPEGTQVSKSGKRRNR